jgi:dTDP-glucose pyrophosphorylase
MDDRLSGLLVGPEITIREALQTLDASAMRLVLVVDASHHLLGVLSDGDVRRWILAGHGLEKRAGVAMNTDPVVVGETASRSEIEELMVSRRIDLIPVVDSSGVVVRVVSWTDLFEEPHAEREQLGMPVVIMAGGKGTRLAPFTSILPKPLVPLNDKPIVEHIMERFAAYGCEEFLMSVNYKANLIKAYLEDEDLPWRLSFVEEPQPLGTGGSLSLMRDRLTEPFFVTNCDVLVEADYADIVRFHRESGDLITVVASMKHMTVPYGVCEIQDGGRLASIVEKPDFDFLVSTGFYVLSPEVLADVPDGRFFHLTELIDTYLADGRRVGVYPVSEGSWLDIGQIEELRETLARFGSE